ncbi:hypothetical protein ES703_58963 [subsurface metagenome]
MLRFLDRVGKGLRTAPRDALIAASTDEHGRGRAFGFQRALDHTGAMLGPLLAFILLRWSMTMEHVFMASVIPGIALVFLVVLGLKTPPAAKPAEPPGRIRWRGLDARVKGLVLASGGLALATTPEAFLVLWANQGGIIVTWVPLLWAAAHGVKALVSGPAGALSDRFGRLRVVCIAAVGFCLAAGWRHDRVGTVPGLCRGVGLYRRSGTGPDRRLRATRAKSHCVRHLSSPERTDGPARSPVVRRFVAMGEYE